MANITVRKPCRVVCEGAADRSFFNSLIKIHEIANFEADCARLDKDPNRCAGKTAITQTLRGLKGYSELEPGKLQGVIIAIDTDSDPNARLAETIESIKVAGLRSPSGYLEIKRGQKDEEFSIAILGIPWHDRSGNLDLLLFDAIQTTHADVIKPLNTFCDQTRNRHEHWEIGAQSKMRLRCTIAASYEDDPGLALSYLLDRPDNPIDLRHAALIPVANFLREFSDAIIPRD